MFACALHYRNSTQAATVEIAMSVDDIIKLIQTLGFPILVALWFMRRDDKGIEKLRQQNTRIIRALALLAHALEAKEAAKLLTEEESSPRKREE